MKIEHLRRRVIAGCFDEARLAANLKTLGDPNRLRIIAMLSHSDELCACKLLEELDISQPTLSHHMAALRDMGLVSARKDGRWMRYSLDKELLGTIGACLADSPCGRGGSLARRRASRRSSQTRLIVHIIKCYHCQHICKHQRLFNEVSIGDTAMDNDTFIPMGDAARVLGVTKPRISQLLSSGELTGLLVGGRRMIDRYLAGKAAAVEFDASRTFVLMSAAHEVAVVRHDPRKDNPLVFARSWTHRACRLAPSPPAARQNPATSQTGGSTGPFLLLVRGCSPALAKSRLPISPCCHSTTWRSRSRIVIAAARHQ